MSCNRLLALLAAVACLVLIAGCAHEEPVATVNGERIEEEEVEGLIELYKSRAEAREGASGEEEKEEVSHAQEVGALQVLVRREVLDQKARELGVTVDEHEVDEAAERLEGSEAARGEGESETEEGAVRDQIRELARAQLIYQALHRRVTANVRVSTAEVLAYYRSHRSSYPASGQPGNRPSAGDEATIRNGLLAAARDKAMARFVARVLQGFRTQDRVRGGLVTRTHEVNRPKPRDEITGEGGNMGATSPTEREVRAVAGGELENPSDAAESFGTLRLV
jgi:hypothetical protein